MDKRLFASIGLKFDRPRWQVHLGFTVLSVVGAVVAYVSFWVLYILLTMVEGMIHGV